MGTMASCNDGPRVTGKATGPAKAAGDDKEADARKRKARLSAMLAKANPEQRKLILSKLKAK